MAAKDITLADLAKWADVMGDPNSSPAAVRVAQDKVRAAYRDVTEEQHMRIAIDALGSLGERSMDRYASVYMTMPRPVA